eukprot:3689102-Pleurochrysis_carterae.AAC.2
MKSCRAERADGHGTLGLQKKTPSDSEGRRYICGARASLGNEGRISTRKHSVPALAASPRPILYVRSVCSSSRGTSAAPIASAGRNTGSSARAAACSTSRRARCPASRASPGCARSNQTLVSVGQTRME